MNAQPSELRGLVLLDLDGTLLDSAQGIIESAINAFAAVGMPAPSEGVLRTFVGPPIAESLARAGVPAGLLDVAVRGFRSDFAGASKRGSRVYPGIPEALADLRRGGFQLVVATSKPEIYAVPLCDEFELTPFLEGVFGAPPDGTMVTKADVIARALHAFGRPAEAVMVGDRYHDAHGAAAHHLKFLGAGWGYASPGELEEAGAVSVITSPELLPSAVASLLD